MVVSMFKRVGEIGLGEERRALYGGRVALSLARILAAPFVIAVYLAAAATGWLALAAGGWRGGLLWTGALAATAAVAVSVVCLIWVRRRDARERGVA